MKCICIFQFGGEACAHELVRGVKEVFPSATVETVKTIEETF